MRSIFLVLLVSIPAVAHVESTSVPAPDQASEKAPMSAHEQVRLSTYQGRLDGIEVAESREPGTIYLSALSIGFIFGPIGTGLHWLFTEPDPVPDQAYYRSVEYEYAFIESFEKRSKRIKRSNRMFAGLPGAALGILMVLHAGK